MTKTRKGLWLKHRSVALVLALLFAALVVAQLSYLLFGHAIVSAAYRGESPVAALNEAIRGRDVYPVEKYLLEADVQASQLLRQGWRLFLWIGALLVLFSAGRPWRRGKLIALLAIAGTVLGAALILTRVRFEADSFHRSVDRRLSENQALAEKAARVGKLDLRRLPDHPINGYYFLLDEHMEALRIDDAQQQASRGFGPTTPLVGYELEQEGELASYPTGATRIADGVLLWQSGAGTYLTNRDPMALPLADLGRVEIRMRARRGTKARLVFVTDPVAETPGRRRPILIDIAPGSEFQVYSVDLRGLRRHSQAQEVVDRIELVASDAPDDRVELDYIRFFRDRQEFEKVPVGAAWETIGGEARRLVHAWTGLRVSVDVKLPAETVYLSLGAAVLDDGGPVHFTVKTVTGAEEKEIWSRQVVQGDGWLDATVDLGSYAGRELELVFETTSAEANIAFWSNPVLWSRPRERLNVVILLEDALRADHLSGYGYSRPTSPARDSFAATGAVFENAFSQETKTRPSVPSLMTSLYPTATGVWFFTDVLDDGYTTLAEVMRRQGFATASFVQNPNAGVFAGLQQGFDSVLDNRALGGRADEVFRDRIDRWLRTWSGRNTFLYLHVIDPHGPYDPPPPFDQWFKAAPAGEDYVPELLEMDPPWMDRPTAAGRRNLYDGEILYNDDQFGRLLELLSARGILEDTLFVLLADHGERLGEYGVWGHQPPGYVEGIHVPLFMVHPGKIRAGQRIAAPVQLLDVMPTILDVAGIDASDLVLQGDSLVPLLRGERSEEWRDRLVISEEVIDRVPGEEGPWGSVFFRDWQLLTSKSFSGPLAAVLRRGPGWLPDLGLGTQAFRYTEREAERSPYASFHADWTLYRSARRALLTMQRQNRLIGAAFASGEPKAIELDPEVQERLRALGYLK